MNRGLFAHSHHRTFFGHIAASSAFWGRRSGRSAANEAERQPLEGHAELKVEPAVEERVQRRVDPTEPSEDRVDKVRDRLVRGHERGDEVHDEEGQPTADEEADDDGQALGRPLFALP